MEYEIKIYVNPSKLFKNLIDHYFLVIDDYEYHLGIYRKGRTLPFGTTKNAHLVTSRKICSTCFKMLWANLEKNEDSRMIWLFPFINCESLTIGCSLQILILINIPLSIVLFYKGYFVYGIIALMLIMIVILLWSRYVNSKKPTIKYCKHLKKR